jgi:hypothetical protein
VCDHRQAADIATSDSAAAIAIEDNRIAAEEHAAKETAADKSVEKAATEHQRIDTQKAVVHFIDRGDADTCHPLQPHTHEVVQNRGNIERAMKRLASKMLSSALCTWKQNVAHAADARLNMQRAVTRFSHTIIRDSMCSWIENVSRVRRVTFDLHATEIATTNEANEKLMAEAFAAKMHRAAAQYILYSLAVAFRSWKHDARETVYRNRTDFIVKQFNKRVAARAFSSWKENVRDAAGRQEKIERAVKSVGYTAMAASFIRWKECVHEAVVSREMRDPGDAHEIVSVALITIEDNEVKVIRDCEQRVKAIAHLARRRISSTITSWRAVAASANANAYQVTKAAITHFVLTATVAVWRLWLLHVNEARADTARTMVNAMSHCAVKNLAAAWRLWRVHMDDTREETSYMTIAISSCVSSRLASVWWLWSFHVTQTRKDAARMRVAIIYCISKNVAAAWRLWLVHLKEAHEDAACMAAATAYCVSRNLAAAWRLWHFGVKDDREGSIRMTTAIAYCVSKNLAAAWRLWRFHVEEVLKYKAQMKVAISHEASKNLAAVLMSWRLGVRKVYQDTARKTKKAIASFVRRELLKVGWGESGMRYHIHMIIITIIS